MTQLIAKTLKHVYDALEALRETPLRPRDAFNNIKYTVHLLKHPQDHFETASRNTLTECMELLRQNRPREASEKVRVVYDAMLVKATRMGVRR